MPNKTLYLKDSDVSVWEEAQQRLGSSVSALFIDCLRERLERERSRPATDKMGKITIELWNEDEKPVIKKSFVGRWLISPDQHFRAEQDDSGVSWDAGAEYAVAQTKNGRIAVYTTHCNDGFAPSFEVYESFGEMTDALLDNRYPAYPQNVQAETAAALGVAYEIELDI